MEHHFLCTACGKCCHGWLPLTLDEAVAHAGTFPLAMIWTPVRRGSKAYAPAIRLGVTLTLHDRHDITVLVMPTVYLPPHFPCPWLTEDGLCRIHADKPLRCQTMPFYPYQSAGEQRSYLTPRAGWACDTSATAPVVYRDKTIVDADAFNREETELQRQAPELRTYAALLLKTTPTLSAHLGKAMKNPAGGKLIIDFASFLSTSKRIDARAFAGQQIPVLQDYATRTAHVPALSEYHQHYRRFAAGLQRYL